jgi:hypothetical protein
VLCFAKRTLKYRVQIPLAARAIVRIVFVWVRLRNCSGLISCLNYRTECKTKFINPTERRNLYVSFERDNSRYMDIRMDEWMDGYMEGWLGGGLGV